MERHINKPADMNNLTDGEKKHLPVIHAPDSVVSGVAFDVTVRVGELMKHPNEEGHHIEWIELYAGNLLLCKATLTPVRAEPNVTFRVSLKEPGKLRAVESCNLHGLWEGEKDILIK